MRCLVEAEDGVEPRAPVECFGPTEGLDETEATDDVVEAWVTTAQAVVGGPDCGDDGVYAVVLQVPIGGFAQVGGEWDGCKVWRHNDPLDGSSGGEGTPLPSRRGVPEEKEERSEVLHISYRTDVRLYLKVDDGLDRGETVDCTVVDGGVEDFHGGITTFSLLVYVLSGAHDGALKGVGFGNHDSSSEWEAVDLSPCVNITCMSHAKTSAPKYREDISNTKGKKSKWTRNGINKKGMVNDTSTMVPFLLELAVGMTTSP